MPKGEGFSGTCIKDTWTKPKRVGSRVGWLGWGELWRESGDNCTWTTIKNVGKKEKRLGLHDKGRGYVPESKNSCFAKADGDDNHKSKQLQIGEK